MLSDGTLRGIKPQRTAAWADVEWQVSAGPSFGRQS